MDTRCCLRQTESFWLNITISNPSMQLFATELTSSQTFRKSESSSNLAACATPNEASESAIGLRCLNASSKPTKPTASTNTRFAHPQVRSRIAASGVRLTIKSDRCTLETHADSEQQCSNNSICSLKHHPRRGPTSHRSPNKVYHQNSVRRYRIPRVSTIAPIVFHPREILPNPVMPDLSRPSGF